MKRDDRRPEFFPVFPGDWLASEKVACMLPEEEGAYWRLLLLSFRDPACSLPNDEHKLAIMSRLNDRWPAHRDAIMVCFEPHPDTQGRLVNPRLFAEWKMAKAQMAKVAEQRSKAGQGNRKKSDGPSTGRQRAVVTRARGTELNGTELNGTEKASAARANAAAGGTFDPEVEALARIVESPPAGIVVKFPGSTKRRHALAVLFEANGFGPTRVSRAIRWMMANADTKPELRSLWDSIANWEDCFDGEHGPNRIAVIEKTMNKETITRKASDGDDWGTPLDAQ